MIFSREVLGYPIKAEVMCSGDDYLVNVLGGCRPHIGSVSLCSWESGNISLKKILLPGHRDDVVGDMFAMALSQRLKTSVAVSCGIHYEAPGREGISEILDASRLLLKDIEEFYSSDR